MNMTFTFAIRPLVSWFHNVIGYVPLHILVLFVVFWWYVFLHQSFYVEAKEDAINVAYTSDALELHMDLVYYQSPPGLQLLHCLQ